MFDFDRFARTWLTAFAIMFVLAMVGMVWVGMAEGAESAEGATNGVIALERVIELPQDSGKWHLSVIGTKGDPQSEAILTWIKDNDNLKGLRAQVHYHVISSGTVIYKERYAPNISGLPAVRLQKHNGEVVYEACGDNLPLSAEGLFGALADSTNKAQGLGLFRPWRRRTCPDGLCPKPKPEPTPPPKSDPAPAPVGPGGPPVVDNPREGWLAASAGVGALAALLSLALGAGASLVVQWRRKRS